VARKARGAPKASPARKVPRVSIARKVPEAGVMAETSWGRVSTLQAWDARVQLLGKGLPVGTRACYDHTECSEDEALEASNFVDLAESTEAVARRA